MTIAQVHVLLGIKRFGAAMYLDEPQSAALLVGVAMKVSLYQSKPAQYINTQDLEMPNTKGPLHHQWTCHYTLVPLIH